MEIDNDRFSERIKQYDDFDLNTMIERTGPRGSLEVPMWVQDQLFLEWDNRHPNTLPPCFASIPFPDCYEGPTTVYEWPQA